MIWLLKRLELTRPINNKYTSRLVTIVDGTIRRLRVTIAFYQLMLTLVYMSTPSDACFGNFSDFYQHHTNLTPSSTSQVCLRYAPHSAQFFGQQLLPMTIVLFSRVTKGAQGSLASWFIIVALQETCMIIQTWRQQIGKNAPGRYKQLN
jgi:hypothetical protein